MLRSSKSVNADNHSDPWREQWAGTVHSPEDMVRFVDAVGCCTKSPLPGYPNFPNWGEAMGELDPGVPDPWFWKDDLHIEKRIYYTRVFGGQPGFVSYESLPAMMATCGEVADELMFDGAHVELVVVVERQGDEVVAVPPDLIIQLLMCPIFRVEIPAGNGHLPVGIVRSRHTGCCPA